MRKTVLGCLLACCLLVAAAGCGSSGAKLDASGGVDAAAGGGMDAGAAVADMRVRDWSRVEALLLEAASDAGVSSLGLTIWNANDARVYERMVGGFTPDTRVALA